MSLFSARFGCGEKRLRAGGKSLKKFPSILIKQHLNYTGRKILLKHESGSVREKAAPERGGKRIFQFAR